MVLQDLKIKYPDYAVYDNERWRNVLIKHKNIFQRKSFILLNEIKAENDQEKFLTTIETISKGKLFYEENNMKLSVNMNVYIYICCLFCIQIVDDYVNMIECINNGNSINKIIIIIYS